MGGSAVPTPNLTVYRRLTGNAHAVYTLLWSVRTGLGTHAGRSYPDDVDIAPRGEAEVVDDVSLRDGVHFDDIEGRDNVRKTFSVRYVDQ